jgi:hypothetical protein
MHFVGFRLHKNKNHGSNHGFCLCATESLRNAFMTPKAHLTTTCRARIIEISTHITFGMHIYKYEKPWFEYVCGLTILRKQRFANDISYCFRYMQKTIQTLCHTQCVAILCHTQCVASDSRAEVPPLTTTCAASFNRLHLPRKRKYY